MILTALPTPPNTTVVWGGDCASAVALVCNLTLDSDKTVEITFSP